jgi:dipeptidyl aminopeptidase/acylaminoacyl peptidase
LDVPPVSLGGTQDFVFSPDGEELAFVANPDEVVAVSTNNSVFLQRLDGIEAEGEPWSISETDAMEREPRYSPDGTRIAYLGAQQAGYEADRMRVRVYNRQNGETRTLTENFDRSAREHGWQNDHEILFLAPDRGFISLYGVEVPPVHHADVTDGPDATVRQYTSGVTQRNLCVGSEEEIVLVRESMTDPPDLFVVRLDEPQPPDLQNGSGRPNSYSPSVRGVTRERQKLDAVTRSDVEGLWYEGADGDLVHGFLMKPPEFDAEARYPLLLLVHGGPQSAFFDQFHFRWNASVFAGAGFVVAMLNPRGSVGYGSRFTDQISGDWGGRCYEDLMRGVDAILSRFSFVEEDRMVAAGGSFGGFMISWIAGHTDRFRALVCHDGIFNQESMSYTTDELWFDIWEHGGVPFDDPERFRRQSPHLVVDRMNTPMLVVQGERDYRCPVGEGIALFTALQMRGVPSRLLYFEDEGHFVTKPANAQVWYETVIQFLRSYV